MDGFKVRYIDYIEARAKNLQKLNTIEIYYYISTDDLFVIEYNFHKIDFKMWEEVIEIHKEENDDAILYYKNKVVKKIENEETYYTCSLKSQSFNLHRNINLILYLEKGVWDNEREMIRKNVWND